MSRAPRKLIKEVERRLRQAKVRRLAAVVPGATCPELWQSSEAPDCGAGPLYVWSAWLPDGQLLQCVTNRSIPPAKRPYFQSMVHALAEALHRGQHVGGLEVRHTPECMATPSGCICTPTVVVRDGQVGRDATYRLQGRLAQRWGVPVL